MRKSLATNNQPMRLNIAIRCKGKRVFRVYIEDTGKRNSKYAEREIKVNGSRMIYFSLPVTTNQMTFCCEDKHGRGNADFELQIEKAPLEKYNIWLDRNTRDFLGLGIYFCQVCGFEKASPKGRIFQTKDEYFTIKYYPVIVDFKKNRTMKLMPIQFFLIISLQNK